MQFNISFQHSMNVANVTVIKIFKKALTLFFFWQKFNFANCCFLLSRIIFFFCNFARVYFRELAFFQNFCEYMFSWIAVCQIFREVLFSWIIPKFTKLLLGKINHLKASVVISFSWNASLLSNFCILLSTLREHTWKEKTGAISFFFLLIFSLFVLLVYSLLVSGKRFTLRVFFVISTKLSSILKLFTMLPKKVINVSANLFVISSDFTLFFQYDRFFMENFVCSFPRFSLSRNSFVAQFRINVSFTFTHKCLFSF